MKIFKLLIILSFLLQACTSLHTRHLESDARIIVSEFIYDEAPFPQCHASTILETDSGLMAAWFGGTYESHPDVSIYVSTRQQGKWSDPMLVADGIQNDSLRYPCWNPVLVKRDNGDIILFYKAGPNPREWWGCYKVLAAGEKNWSASQRLPDSFLGPVKNKSFELTDGTYLHPSSFETNEKWGICLEKSDQELGKWERTEIDNRHFNAIQPAILKHKKKTLQMLCRSRENRIVESWSYDLGKSWTPLAETGLVNNNSGIDAVTLRNGLHLLVCNPIEKGRNKLSLLVSPDGNEWKELLVLEDQPVGEFSYPAIIEDKDGTVHITYTYNRVKMKYLALSITP